MFWQGYFYWCGVVLNAVMVLAFVIGIALSVRNWRIESELKLKNAAKNLRDEGEEEEKNDAKTG